MALVFRVDSSMRCSFAYDDMLPVSMEEVSTRHRDTCFVFVASA